MIISFFGHSSIPYYDEENLENKVYEILETELKDVKTIKLYLGGYGRFSTIALKSCLRFKKIRPDALTYYITPYITESHFTRCKEWFRITDNSIYPPLEKVPKRLAIVRRNNWMINHSDLIILFVDHTASYAGKILEQVIKSKKRFINIGKYNG